MKKLPIALLVWIIPAIGFGAACSDQISGTESCDEITQYGITWTLSSNETVGQFYNGDYYIIDDGSVTVSSVSPATTGTGSSTDNGSMKNPTVYPNPNTLAGSQGLDGNANRFIESLVESYPVSLTAGDVLVSSISTSYAGPYPYRWDGVVGADSDDRVWSVAYLTVVDNTYSDYSDYFRPAPTDRDQTLYDSNDLNTALLPSLDTSGTTIPSHSGFASALDYAERGTERPWPLWVYNYNGKYIHAMNNMYNYHREVGHFLSYCFVLLTTDLSGKDELAENLVQIGIDMYHAGVLGKPDSSFYMAPILLAGWLLDNSTLLNSAINGDINATAYGIPRDFPDFYYLDDVTPAESSATVPEGETWRGDYQAAFRNNINAEYEHRHPSEWNTTTGFSWSHESSYRVAVDSSQHVGMVFFANVADLETEWNHAATFDYMDYWMACDEACHIAECEIKEPYNVGIDCDSYTHQVRSESTYFSTNTFIDYMWSTYYDSGVQPGVQPGVSFNQSGTLQFDQTGQVNFN